MKQNLYSLLVNFFSFLMLCENFQSEAISAYWSSILPQICGIKVSQNITQALYACDKLMDKQLSNIFDHCVRNVNHLEKNEKLSKPKLCYYARLGVQLDRCKMSRYQSEGITLLDLVEREQDHTWCLMKIAQPLGWERLCSDNTLDVSFLMSKQSFIQNCEKRFSEITTPIRECFKETIVSEESAVSSFFNWGRKRNRSQMQFKPAACLSFQYSRKIWKCLAQKNDKKTIQRRANMYIGCLKAIRRLPQK